MSHIEDFNKYLKEIQDKYQELSNQLSKIDGAQDDILHFLEFASYDAITMVKVTKKLKDIRNQRREIKNELAMIQKIHSRIGTTSLVYKKPNTYTCKSDVLSDFMDGKKIKDGRHDNG